MNQLAAVCSQVLIIVIVNSEICFMCIASQRVVHMSSGADLDCRTGRTFDSQHSAAQQYF